MFGLEKDSNLPSRQTLFTHYIDKNRDKVAQEPNRITVYVYNHNTWVWCIPFSNGVTSLGFVGFPDFFSTLTGTAEENIKYLVQSHPELNERFGDCEMAFEPMELKSWSATTDKFYGKGFVLTGNVTEFLDPMFSSGVTLASVSAQNAAHLVIKKLQKELYDILAHHTGKSYEEVERDCDRDNWLNATEAKEYGLVDEVLERKKPKTT